MSKLRESRIKLHDWIIGYDYFISYSHNDGKDYPSALKQLLEQRGFKVCLDQQDFYSGKELHGLTKRRLQASQYLIILARPYALTNSKWVPKEVSLFLESQSDKSSGPIAVDINHSITNAIESNSRTNTLANLIDIRNWLRIEESLIDIDGIPSKTTINEIAKSFNGIRAEKRQIRIQFTAIVALILATLSFGVAAYTSYTNSIIAQAEGLAAAAMAEATTQDPRVGFAGSAFAKAADALTQRSTTGTRRSATRVLQDTPANIKYSPHRSESLGNIAIVEDEVFVTEGSEKLNVYSANDLTHLRTETAQTLGIDFIGNAIATNNGVVVTGRLEATWVEDGQKDYFKIPGWVQKSDYHNQLGTLVYSNQREGVFWTNKERVQHSETPVSCQPPNDSTLLGYALGEDNSVVIATRGAAGLIEIHRVDLMTCNTNHTVELVDSGYYDMIRVDGETIIRTTKQILILNSSFETVQLLHDPGITVWVPLSISEGNKSAKGFITTHGKGFFRIYTRTNDGRYSLTEETNTLLPGQVVDLAQRQGSNEVLISARAGHFVSSDLPGVLAKAPLTLRSYNGIHSIHFQQYEPAVSAHSFNYPVIRSTSNSQSLFAGLSDGSVYRVDDAGKATEISKNDQTADRPNYSLLALAANNNDVFVARKISDDRAALLKIDGNKEIPIINETLHIEDMAATNEVVIYRTRNDFYVLDLNTNTRSEFKVSDFNGNQGHKTMVTSPDGKWIVLGLFGGFDLRETSLVTQGSTCTVSPQEDAAGAVAAFSSDSKHLVLGTLEGQLSLWKQDASCWTKIRDFETERGTMISTVAFIEDNKTIIGNLFQTPSRLQLWEVATGKELGLDYPTSAKAIFPLGKKSFLLLRDQDTGVIETSARSLIGRLCSVARNVILAGLTSYEMGDICAGEE